MKFLTFIDYQLRTKIGGICISRNVNYLHLTST